MPCTRSLLLAVAIAAVWFSLLILTVTPGQAASVLLSWSAPTKNGDGTTLTDLAGYKVYYGPSSKNYTSTRNAGNVLSVSIGELLDGQTYYLAVTAYDASGNESGFSNEIHATPSTGSPSPPPSTSSGPVAAYAFDEGSRTTLADAAGHGHTGTLQNGPVRRRSPSSLPLRPAAASRAGVGILAMAA